MSDRVRDLMMDHEYDGIREFDNPTPGWWWGLFHLTVVFSIAYYLFFTWGVGSWTNVQEHDAALAGNLRLQFGEIGDLKADAPTILRFMKDEKWLAVGRATFAAKCASCHGAAANGLIGPNMTDDFYKNVKKIEDIASVIANGAAGSAMPAQRNNLHPTEIVLTASYIASLRGQNLPGPRGVEGDKIEPWPAVASSAPADEKSRK
jgi:cytochrome c oxidase cbb3-type subunit III